jgi:hypothetical protein
MSNSNNDTIDSKHPEYVGAQTKMSLVSDLLSGIEAVRERGDYLLQMESESADQYNIRLQRSTLNPGFSEAITAQTSKPFSKEVTIEQFEKLSPEVKAILKDLDGRGKTITELGKDIFAGCASYQEGYIFTDFVSRDQVEDGRTLADDTIESTRTFSFFIPRTSLINWEFDEDGKYSEIRFITTELVKTSKFGKKNVNVIYRWTKEIWEKYQEVSGDDCNEEFIEVSGSKSWELVKNGVNTLKKIPIESTDFGPSWPNMDLAYTVLEHYQDNSDQKNIVRFSRTGLWYAAGFEDDELEGFAVGSNKLISSADPDASLSVVEHSGSAVGIGRAELEILERRIQALVLKPIVTRTSGDVTATEVIQTNANASSDIRAWGLITGKALTNVIEWIHVWLNIDVPEGVRVLVYDDYVIEGSSADNDFLLQTFALNGITHETFLSEIKRRGTIDNRVDIAKEVEQAKKEANEKAEAAAKIVADNAPKPAIDNKLK